MRSSFDDPLQLRAVNAHVFCPRLFWLEYVAGEFVDNAHTLEGSHVHRRVDQPGGSMPAPQASDEASKNKGDDPWHTRSLWLSDDTLGLTGKLDLVDLVEEGRVMPVDTKKGKPTRDGALWEADRAQLTLQALLLKAQGYQVASIAAWYHGSRQRVVEALTPEMETWALGHAMSARHTRSLDKPPAPLVDAPQCRGCSLNGVCLPDEVNALTGGGEHEEGEIRRVLVPDHDAVPVYVTEGGTRVGLKQNMLKITPRRGSEMKPAEVGLGAMSQLNLMGGVQITTQAMQALLRRDVPVSFFSYGGFYYGRTQSATSRNVRVRIAQFKHADSEVALSIARALIADKLYNARVFLRRHLPEGPESKRALRKLTRIRKKAEKAESVEQLLGYEGEGARQYWAHFDALMQGADEAWAMQGRNRRPPRDPVNAMLSFGYALLVKDAQLAVEAAGLDAYLGVYHTAHHGRPSMALDLMEPFRRLIVDSAVYLMVRRGEVSPENFVRSGQAVAMKTGARKALIAAYERRMAESVIHPLFGYAISYRRIIAVQARLLARVLTGEIAAMPNFRTR
ncbi:CRISPR-associated endonuclease Cas1 [Lujinxingia vulgaris]|uniref:CRISPR-associated endonuclease Cas1 n=1 Tax=Lujinxingia vulgaris TaxID=2600176 RepID=A0A5C6X3G0_9DELT|nr:CRISPR-associated endonuclease Cas1 [Lujinxingia vulgaris]TXD34810.1 CRISPR-associated endonuclease Cas1 [Lujinxingia vulgaris]